MFEKAFVFEKDLTDFVDNYKVNVISITCDSNGVFILFYKHGYEIII